MSDKTMTGRAVGGAYRITGFQRPGRMGDIYVGRKIDTNDLVSVKMLDPAMFNEAEAIRRFERETRITQKLVHPCSLEVLDYGRTDDGLPYMVTEYVQGEALSDVIEESDGGLPPERAAYLAAQIAMALDAAHAIGVIHRDLAPTNILVTDAEGQEDSIKVIEFGLSRLTEPGEEGEGSALTAVGVRIGTPFYMAPEYIEEYSLDHRADLYSLGIVMFEMLTGKPPFTGRPYKVMDKHLTEDPPAPSTVVEGVPEWLDKVVLGLLKKDPNERPQKASDVVKAIEAGLGQRLLTVQAPTEASPEEQSTAAGAPDRAHAAPGGGDPQIAAFIDKQIRSVDRGKGSIDPKSALVVHRVASQCIAAKVGVKRGWLCSLPDEDGRGLLSAEFWREPADERRYVFAAPDGSEKVELRCSGTPVGVEFLRHPEHLQANYSGGDADALLELWLQKAWVELEDLAMRDLSRQKGAAAMLNTGLFARFLGGGGGIKDREQPALALHGAALIEQGKAIEGLEQVREYGREYAHHHPDRYNAITLYYEALERENLGNIDYAVDLLVQSWLAWPNTRIAARVRELTGRIPDNRAWYGKQFPDYTLDDSRTRGRTVGLYRTLMGLEPHQVHLVVMLGGARASEAYDEVMRRYVAWAPRFSGFLGGVHVITDSVSREGVNPEWLAGEDAVLAAGLPFEVLEDYRGFLRRAIKPASSPTVYGVTTGGVVVHEGQLDAVGVWEMLRDASKLRMM